MAETSRGSEPAVGAPAGDTVGPSGSTASRVEMPARYEDLGRIARGGWGEIRRARDITLDRIVVVKVLAWDHLDSDRVLGRFLNEASITASLEHPGIVPVYDRGVLADGRPWFAMKEVRGATLESILRDGLAGAPDGTTRLRRLVDLFARVCETVGYAHRRAIVHRDLKPANLMVGELGEVLVLDWGIAKKGREDAASIGRAPRAGLETQAGDVLGTVAYMSPEQASGWADRVGPPSDVFALGLTLYEIVTGKPARPDGRPWAEALAGTAPVFPDPSERPEASELSDVYARAIELAPERRYEDAAELGEALRAWLDGAARREKATRLVAEADKIAARTEDLRRARDELRAQAARLLADVRPGDPSDRKAPAWRIEDEASAFDQRVAVLETEQLTALGIALEHDPEHAAAHARLAATNRARLIEAEARGASSDAVRFELSLRRHNRGEHDRFLRGNGAFALDTDPTGATVRIFRFVLRDRRLVEEDTGICRTAPVICELPAGSYLALLEHPGCGPVRYPFRIGRDDAWPTVRPGSASPTAIALCPSLAAEEVYVPAGWVDVGGDALAAEPVPARRIWIDGFAIHRDPVTCAEYLAFLDDLHASGRTELALRYAPRWPQGASAEEPIAVRLVAERFELTPDEHGRTVDPRWPVQSIDWHSAHAYCAWLSQRSGSSWRLPNELEWEKAARGVDQRPYPWGAQPEPTWARMLGSLGAPCRVPVDATPTDTSPYGVRGLAGNVRDWCANAWALDGPAIDDGGILRISAGDPADPSLRTIRGGAWNTVPAFARCAGRFATLPSERFSAVGFRVARSLPPR